MSVKTEYEMVNRYGSTMIVTSYDVDSPKGTAIIHHGYPGAAVSPTIMQMAKAFNQLGLRAVVPDTTNNFNKSDGELEKMSLAGHGEDLEDVIKTVVDTSDFQGHLIVAGHSAGGHSALAVSARIDKAYRPALTVASSPVISGTAFVANFQQALNLDISDWKKEGYISIGSDVDGGRTPVKLHWCVMEEWQQHDLTRDKVSPKNPAVIIHPTADDFIKTDEILGYVQAAEISEFHQIVGADHGYTQHEEAFAAKLKDVVSRHMTTWKPSVAAIA